MTGEITNGMLLRHIQAMKNDLQQQISTLDRKFTAKFDSLEIRFDDLEVRMESGFEEARQHREALQEDLNATIRMVAKHETKLLRH